MDDETDNEVLEEKEPTKRPPKGRVANFLAGEVVKKIKKVHGEAALLKASDMKVLDTPRIPTGIFSLDYALGGGFPVGRISTLYGEKSAGKTTLFLKAIANAQKMCSNCYTMWDSKTETCECGDFRETVCAYLDVEGAFDRAWAKKLGVDVDNLILDVPEYAEQALDIGEALIRSGEVDVLVLDSIAFLVPQKEIENSVTKDGMGIAPRLVGKGVRKFVSAINGVGKDTGRRPTIFFTNQIRYKLGVMFGNPETTSGGQAPGFAAAVECRIAAGKYEIDDETQKPFAATFRYKVNKNKTFSAKMSGEYLMLLSPKGEKRVGDAEDENDLVKWAELTELVTRKGGYNCLGRNFRVKKELIEALQQDPTFKRELEKELMPRLLNL